MSDGITISPDIRTKTRKSRKVQEKEETRIYQNAQECPKNKFAISIAAAAGAAAIAGASILIYKNQGNKTIQGVFEGFKKLENALLEQFEAVEKKTDSIVEDSKLIQQEAAKVQQEAKEFLSDPKLREAYNEVMSLIRNAKKTHFEPSFDSTAKTGSEYIMEHSHGRLTGGKLRQISNGVVERETNFLISGKQGEIVINNITENSQNGKIMYTFHGGRPWMITVNSSDMGDIVDRYRFNDSGMLLCAQKGMSRTTKGFESIKGTIIEHDFQFERSGLSKYAHNAAEGLLGEYESCEKLYYYDKTGNVAAAFLDLNNKKNTAGTVCVFDKGNNYFYDSFECEISPEKLYRESGFREHTHSMQAAQMYKAYYGTPCEYHRNLNIQSPMQQCEEVYFFGVDKGFNPELKEGYRRYEKDLSDDGRRSKTSFVSCFKKDSNGNLTAQANMLSREPGVQNCTLTFDSNGKLIEKIEN